MFIPRLFRVALFALGAGAIAGCGGSGGASGPASTPNAVGTLVTQSRPKGKVPTPAPTPTRIPASDFTATISGTVTEQKTGVPIAGAAVVVGDRLRTAKTDAGGRYRISFPARATVAVTASKPGYAGALAIGTLPVNGRTTLNLRLIKHRPGVPPVPPMPVQFGGK